MTQDVISDRLGLVQAHECSWPAAPYHANKFYTKKRAMNPPTSEMSVQEKNIFGATSSHKPLRIINRFPLSIRNVGIRKKKIVTSFCSIRVGALVVIRFVSSYFEKNILDLEEEVQYVYVHEGKKNGFSDRTIKEYVNIRG